MITRKPIYYKTPINKRKPIHIPHNRKSIFNPEFLDVDSLLMKFTPLIQSLHKYFCSYCGILDQPADCEDLYSQIQFEFLKLCQKYDPRRGVDFTGYIQFNLRHRIYYYVCKLQKYQITEQLLKQVEDSTLPLDMITVSHLQNVEDVTISQELSRIEALASIPWQTLTDSFERELMYEVLLQHQPLEDIAKAKKMSIRSVREKFNVLCEKLITIYHNSMERSNYE